MGLLASSAASSFIFTSTAFTSTAAAQGKPVASAAARIRSADADERKSAIDELAAVGTDFEIVMIGAALAGDSDASVRVHAAQALGGLSGESAAAPLRECVRGPGDAELKRTCRVALAQVASKAPDPSALAAAGTAADGEAAALQAEASATASAKLAAQRAFRPIAIGSNLGDYVALKGLSVGVEIPNPWILGVTGYAGLMGSWVDAAVGGVGLSSTWLALDVRPTIYLRGTNFEGPYASLRLSLGRIALSGEDSMGKSLSYSAMTYGTAVTGGWAFLVEPNMLIKIGAGPAFYGSGLEAGGSDGMGGSGPAPATPSFDYQGLELAVDAFVAFMW